MGLDCVLLDKRIDGWPGDIFLQNTLVLHIDVQHNRYPDTCVLKPFVVIPLRFNLIAERIIAARLVVDLLEHIGAAVFPNQIGIAALAVTQ